MAHNTTSDGNMFYKCTEVSALCPVKSTTLGYYPNKPLNIFLAAAFGLALVIQLFFGVWKRTWSYMSFIVAGCALELAGGYFSCSAERRGDEAAWSGVKRVLDRLSF